MRADIEVEVPGTVTDVIDFLLRPVCLVCREPTGDSEVSTPMYQGNLVCRGCLDNVEYLEEPSCPRCGTPTTPNRGYRCVMCGRLPERLSRMRSSSWMRGVGGQLIRLFKYEGWKALAVPLVLKMASSRWFDRVFWDADLLVPVPIARARRRERGYNQSALLAEELSGLVGIPVGREVLQRRAWSRPQVGLSYRKRVSNVKGAFEVRRRGAGRISGLRIILIDDVITTGATTSACCEALLAAGARSVSSASFGRADSASYDPDAW